MGKKSPCFPAASADEKLSIRSAVTPDGIGSPSVPMSSPPPLAKAMVPRQVKAAEALRLNLSTPFTTIALFATVLLLVSSPHSPLMSSVTVCPAAMIILCPAADGGVTPPTQVAPSLNRPVVVLV